MSYDNILHIKLKYSAQIYILLFLTNLAPARVGNGSALRRNVQEPALFMEPDTTTRLISEHTGFKEIVLMLLPG